jgi:hypothetical protein
MKGFIVKPKKPAEVVKKLKLSELVSTNTSDMQINSQVTMLFINGGISPYIYKTYFRKVGDCMTFLYEFYDRTIGFFAALHSEFCR